MRKALRLIFTAIICICLHPALSGQTEIRGIVRDSMSRHPIAFAVVAVEGNPRSGVMTDIDGAFSIKVSQLPATLNISIIGYKRKRQSLNATSVLIELAPVSMGLKEVTIVAGENPAHRIVRNTWQNRDKHDPLSYKEWSCSMYQKMLLTGTPDSSWKAATKEDSLDNQSADSLFQKQHLFMIEAASDKFYKNGKEKEIVRGSRVSGLNDPSILLMALRFQPFTCYRSMMNISGIDYVNPINRNSEDLYRFSLEDTLFSGSDTTYIIAFEPRKGKTFSGLKGMMHISAPDFAVQRFSAAPASEKTGSSALRIRQGYERQPSGRWFPTQMNTWLEFGTANIAGFRTTGEVKTYISNISFSPDFNKLKFDEVIMEIEELAPKRPEVFWDSVRVEQLDDREKNTYVVIDSLGDAMKFDRKIKAVESLVNMRIPVKWVDIDLTKVLRFNDHEGWRLGLGLYTNNRLTKAFSIGGFFGYGFADKAWKYGADGTFNLQRKREFYLRASWSQEVYESGGTSWVSKHRIDRTEQVRNLVVRIMDREERTRLSLHRRFGRSWRAEAFGGTTHLQPQFNYRFGNLEPQTRFSWTEAGIAITWIPGEEFYQSGALRLNMNRKFPELRLQYTAGSGLAAGSNDYQRVEAQLDYKKSWKRAGTSFLRIHGGWVEGDVPYGRLFTARGNLNNAETFRVASGNSFETLVMNAFLSDRFASAFFLHDLGPFFKIADFQPSFALALNALIGDLRNPAQHQQINFSVPRSGYFEAGLLLNNLLTLQSSGTGYGIGGFYRFGAYSDKDWKKNVIIKITLSLPF